MTRETQKEIKRRKQEAAKLVRYANPRSKSRPSVELVSEILLSHIPYRFQKPVVSSFVVTEYHRNRLIKCAYFNVETADGKVFEISAYEHLKGRTPEEKEADRTASFPSGLFRIFHSEIA